MTDLVEPEQPLKGHAVAIATTDDTAPQATAALALSSTPAQAAGQSDPNLHSQAGPSRPPKRAAPPLASEPLESLDQVIARRLTRISAGDNVLIRLPSEAVKAVVASGEGLTSLGKFGAFPSSQLIGLHYDITYEVIPDLTNGDSSQASADEGTGSETRGDLDTQFGQKRKKKNKGRHAAPVGSGAGDSDANRGKPGWKNILRPLKRQPLVDAVIDDITETNEFIDDSETVRETLLSQQEIEELRAQGVSAEEMIRRQIERHESFGLKTDFSKEKWRKRKEKKFFQTVHALAPTIPNIVAHYSERSPHSILHLREDTISQLLTASNVRPGGRYLVVDDSGGLIVAALLERMGCEGRIMQFTENDSPPAWSLLNVMNFSERELECVKWLSWLEADEEYEKPPPPPEDDMPSVAAQKTAARLKRHMNQVADLNATRDELHSGNWDGVILATELSSLSVLARLTPYLAGSSTICVYSPYLQVLAEVLAWTKKDARYLQETITESWSRTYQVLPGRTHPLMNTSATGGYLFTALAVHGGTFEPNLKVKRHRSKKKESKETNGTPAADQEVRAARDSGSDMEEEVEEVLAGAEESASAQPVA